MNPSDPDGNPRETASSSTAVLGCDELRLDAVTMLVEAAKLCRALLGIELAEIGIHPGQDKLLRALYENGEHSPSSLSRELRVRPPTISKMLERLEAVGLIERDSHRSDHRRSVVRLSRDGEARLGSIDAVWRRLAEIATRDFSPEALRSAAAVLEQMEENLATALHRLR
ncbi:DNA-binding MarR family transcriptional regulator [Rhodopseudomonas julia]|uniref:DNA-binding MarR family transcriptional regulator n=1 Tax=Rhodopseudomonas julia TaxID=200617 RepID=A0ABU0C6N6_9BRAD|nr:MarR family winged helix-turn-helix transcriptional regulator [Rhodopseudomonas julia]MDQ0326187.1 DNA-binding MarR family transcriptional regulator [Rhodopseudomonas julia]